MSVTIVRLGFAPALAVLVVYKGQIVSPLAAKPRPQPIICFVRRNRPVAGGSLKRVSNVGPHKLAHAGLETKKSHDGSTPA
jgi:hypothetical protein